MKTRYTFIISILLVAIGSQACKKAEIREKEDECAEMKEKYEASKGDFLDDADQFYSAYADSVKGEALLQYWDNLSVSLNKHQEVKDSYEALDCEE